MTGEELRGLTKEEISRCIREGVKAVLEEVLEEEITERLPAGYRERTPSRRGERNGHYTRGLITPVGKVEQLRVPRDREGAFLTEVFERYKRMTGEVEGAALAMYLQGYLPARSQPLQRDFLEFASVRMRFPESPSAWKESFPSGVSGLWSCVLLPLPRRGLFQGELG